MYELKLSVILGNVGSCSDRYCTGGYSRSYTIEELFDRVRSIDGVSGVEMVANWHISQDNLDEVKYHLKRTGLKPVSIIPDHFGVAKWKNGSFSSKDPGIRREAVEHTKQMIRIAEEIGCPLISLWPGQDGYDYLFQADYIKERTWFEEGVAECCRYNKNIKIAIEYKPKEPRIRSYPSNVYSTLLMIKEIGEDNCGVTIDYGHALAAYENVAESVAVLKKYGDKLFHLHMNDNFTLWDDDMITGSIHTIGYLETFYWLKKTGYSNWISTDQYPYREDGREAVNESIQWIKKFLRVINEIDDSRVEELINTGDACKASSFMREILFK